MPRRNGARPTDDRIRMTHMLEAARQGSSFIAGRRREELKDCIQEIGEAAAKVSDASRALVPQLPWNQIVGMRHRIVHVYYAVDTNALWEVATRDLPVLIGAIEDALSKLPHPGTQQA